MASLTPQQIAQYAAQAGFTGYNLVTAVAIALAESSGDPNAINPGTPQVPENSQGLWQINLNAHPQYSNPGILDPLTNAQAAFAVSSGGANWAPWSTFTNGAYKAYYNQATLAVASAGLGNFFGGIFGSATSALGTPAPIALPTVPSFPNPVTAVSSSGSDILSAINNVGTQLASGVNNLGSGVSQFQAFIAWLDQPNLGTRIALAVVGFFILLLGLILFGVSFLPKGTKLPVPVPV